MNVQHSRLTSAVGAALGIRLIQSAEMSDAGNELTYITVKFIATEDQLRRIGEFLSKEKSASVEALRKI